MILKRYVVMRDKTGVKRQVMHCALSTFCSVLFGDDWSVENITEIHACHIDAEKELYIFTNRDEAFAFLQGTVKNDDYWNFLSDPKLNVLSKEDWLCPT